ncbi:hypothetical protein Q9189_007155 [Teloschistes chrysophthalmus]
MDPISVAASLLGLLGAAAKVSEVLTTFIQAVKDAPKLARRVFSEVEDLTLCFQRIQDFVSSEATVDRSRAAMITEAQEAIQSLAHAVSNVLLNSQSIGRRLEDMDFPTALRHRSAPSALEFMAPSYEDPLFNDPNRTSYASNATTTSSSETVYPGSFTIALNIRARLDSIIHALQLELSGRIRPLFAVTACIGLLTFKLPKVYKASAREPGSEGVLVQVLRQVATDGQGTANAGKSTVLKQLQMMQGTKFTQAEISEARHVIYFNLLKVFGQIFQSRSILSAMAKDLCEDYLPTFDNPETLSGPTLIMQNLPKIFVRENPESHTASLYAHIKTTGVYRSMASLGPFDLELCDVGGSRAVRKKLVHFDCMKDLDYAIYVADLNGYCQYLQEDLDANQMWESLQLFESLLNLPELAGTTVFLFLNKADLFETTILREPILDYFPDYTGGADYWKGTQYFANKFAALDRRPGKKLHCHVTDSLDTPSFQKAWRLRTGAYYNFTNIRYAAPPLGPLRFLPPQEPLPSPAHTILDGTTEGNICPQAAPSSWDWTNANIPNGQVIPIGNSTLPESEDCLFLDVVVPVEVFKRRGKGQGAPVLVNIHGGGFFIGDKATLYPPQGLLAASNNSIIFVSMNYRQLTPTPNQLTAFGFLSSPHPSPTNTTAPNAGLLDQRHALKWIQRYISLFGGSPHHVTLLGESGGGASLMFHAIAYGASPSHPEENNLFHQLIAQSPGPIVGDLVKQDRAAETFLRKAGAGSVDEARGLPSEKLVQANRETEAVMPYFGPSVDGMGGLVPDLPSRLYIQHKTNLRDIRVMAAHNSDEARLFIGSPGDKYTRTQAAFDGFLAAHFPTATIQQIKYINEVLYPGPASYARLARLDADVYNVCWTVLLADTADKAYNYIFSVPPGYHAQDLAYTFYNGEGFQKGVDVGVARVLQRAIADFVVGGDPNGGGGEGDRGDGEGEGKWPVWGRGTRVANLTVEGVRVGREEAVERCMWWFRTAFAGAN